MLYAIGDLHLSMSADKKMDVFGGEWVGYETKIAAALDTLTADDTLLLCGDTSWGMHLRDALADFQFLQRCPAQKLLLKGNHDYFWETAAKMRRFFTENGLHDFDILHNNAFLYNDAALCGTRGWFFEESGSPQSPQASRGEKEKGGGHDAKMINREVGRLRSSLDAGRRLGGTRLFAFLHYPPLYEGYRCEPILEVLREYEVERCYYGHLHAHARAKAFEGAADGTEFRLVSADHVGFRPVSVL